MIVEIEMLSQYLSRTEPNGVKRSQTELYEANRSQMETNRAKQSQTELNRTKQNRVERIHTEQKGARAEPIRTSKTKLKTVPNGKRRPKELHVLNRAEWSQNEPK